MKTRETKKQEKSVVVLSEATDGVNKVRLLRAALAEEEEACPWEEIDAYSGRFVMAGYRYNDGNDDSTEGNDDYHPWLAYSTDGGETWTKSATTANAEQTHGQLHALAYGGGRFVVAGFRYNDGGSDTYHPWLAYSTDGGVTWTPSTTTADAEQPHGQLYALAYGGGRFVVAGFRYNGDDSDNYHPWIAYSTDGGETWTASATTATIADEGQAHGELHALAYGGGRFVVAGYRQGDDSDNYHPWLAYSTDGGVTWTASATTANTEQPHGQLFALTYGGGRFVVAGYRYNDGNDDSTGGNDDYHPWLAYSTDGGKTWTASATTVDGGQTHGLLRALAYGGGRFVVAGHQYDNSGGSDDYRPWIAYSTDGGVTWTPSTTTANEVQAHGLLLALTYGGGRFVVAGYRQGDDSDNYHPWLAYSTDGGVTWTASATTANIDQVHGRLRALTYAPDTYCWKFGKENEEEAAE